MTRQEAENLQDGMQKMAATVWIFYEALIKSGFDDGHAMYLTGRMMDGLVGGIGKAAAEMTMEGLRKNE